MSQPVIDSRGHKLSVNVPAQPIWIEADTLRLVQVIGNLLNNAAKYTKTPGQISMSVRQEDGDAIIRITDTGLGIPPTCSTKSSTSSCKSNPTIARSEGGLGIGLTLVRRLVELHGGKVRASSAGPGKGSEFEVRLPAIIRKPVAPPKPAPAAAEAAETDKGIQPLDRHRVLVVEDNVYAAKSFATLLRLDGHEVQVAHDGPEALRMAETFRPT